LDFLTIKAQYLYAKHSNEYKQEERFNQTLSYEEQFAEKYPSSKFFREAQSLKKDSEDGIKDVKKLFEEAASNERLARKLAKKDTVTGQQPPSEKGNENKKIPN
jgi:outer membrane protein assembly factor BamD